MHNFWHCCQGKGESGEISRFEKKNQEASEHEKWNSCTCDYGIIRKYAEEIEWAVRQTRYQIEYSTCTEDTALSGTAKILRKVLVY